MDNAERQNIHARATCREAGPGTMASVCRRSFADREYETLRLAPLRLSRIGYATSRISARCIPGSVPAAPTRGWNVWRCQGLRVPNLGENREEFVLRFDELREAGWRCRSGLSHPAVCRSRSGAGGCSSLDAGVPRGRRQSGWARRRWRRLWWRGCTAPSRSPSTRWCEASRCRSRGSGSCGGAEAGGPAAE